MTEQSVSGVVDFLYEMGLLKRYKRTGWLIAGVTDAESVADHSHRTAISAAAIASMEGADPQRASFLALFHDTQETRLTDIPYIGKRYLKAATNGEVTADQTSGMPPVLADLIGSAVAEYEEKASLEARCAKDADKLECLLQAIEYREQGTDTQAWIDSSLAALATTSAKQLADEALQTQSLRWMHNARTTKPPTA